MTHKTKVFISGSIEIKYLDERIKADLVKLMRHPKCEILVGDAPGVDKQVQILFMDAHDMVSVYNTVCSNGPRNKMHPKFNVVYIYPPTMQHAKDTAGKKRHGRDVQMLKDKEMVQTADVGRHLGRHKPWHSKKHKRRLSIRKTLGGLSCGVQAAF